ncbi:hypothetical protein CCMSSC00406_0005403 [Pleurotus cornucopiae]|uniref:Uncharacterized protein n=1 Tax=Pleurotus cornucopiae TaxID=5321 RepID=A0ACB7IMX6_PLECO|nr:hypothetical protein CCMSSC00406_0005403 [Pleurotus cornucopiae]
MSHQDKVVFLAYNTQKKTFDLIEESEASSSQTPLATPAADATATESPRAASTTFSVELSQSGAAGPSRPKVLCPRVRHIMIEGLAVMAVGNCVTVPTQTREGGWSIQTIGFLQTDTKVTFRTQLAGMLARFYARQKQKAEPAQQSMRPSEIRVVQPGARQTQTLPPIRDMLPEGFLDSLPRTAPPRAAVQPPTPSDSRGPAASSAGETQQVETSQAALPLGSTAKHNVHDPASKSRSSTAQRPRGWLQSLPELPPLIPKAIMHSMADKETPTTGTKKGDTRKQKSSLQIRAKVSSLVL